jgi:hypothetical protein
MLSGNLRQEEIIPANDSNFNCNIGFSLLLYSERLQIGTTASAFS